MLLKQTFSACATFTESMKLRIFQLGILFFLLTGQINSQEWKVYNSEEGGFSIMTPGLMEAKRATVETGVGDFDVHTLFLNPQDSLGNYLYLINYYDLPEDLVPIDSSDLVDDFLKNTMDQSITDIKGDLLYSNPIAIGDHPGLMWRSRSETGVVKSRIYLIGNRFYMLQVFSTPNKALNNNIDRFLESFTLKTQ